MTEATTTDTDDLRTRLIIALSFAATDFGADEGEDTIVAGKLTAFADAACSELQAATEELKLARSLRLEWPSVRAAVNPDVHTPARTVAYLKGRGWVKDWERRGGEDWHDQPDRDGKMRYVFVPLETGFVDWDKRMAMLVRDLADAYGTGELGVLADIVEAGDA